MGKGNRIDVTKSRFSEAPWVNHLQNSAVTVVGCGGIGSWVTLCLSRIGVRVYLFDADIVEAHNLGGQMLGVASIGSPKVTEVEQLCRTLCGAVDIVSFQEMFDEHTPLTSITILAVDNMQTRKLAYEKWKEEYKDHREALLIDGRLLAEDYQVYSVTPSRLKLYEATLFSDEEVPKENCSLKATTHCSLGIASDIIGCLTNWAANISAYQAQQPETRDVPFSIVKSIPNFFYELNFNNDGKEDRGTPKEERAGDQGVLSVSAGKPSRFS